MISASLQDLFDSPPRDFSPTPLWWWSGAQVTTERIRWQMERFAAGGVFNLVVINLAPAGPLEEAATDDPAWFSEAWWDRFSDACDVAAELGMRMWFYDQIGFSGANLQGAITHEHPEAAGAALRSHALLVSEGRVQVPGGQRVLAASTLAGEPAAVGDDGGVDAPDGSCVQVFTTVPTAFDYLDPAAVALLVDRVHGEFDRRLGHRLGNVIAGSFQDELPATNSWTAALPARFRAQHGYDLLAVLPALFAPLPGSSRHDSPEGRARAAKVRSDYYAVRTVMTEEALFRPLGAWHDARGMLLGADQTNPARQGVPTQSTQLYTDYFRTHRWFSAAGSDHEGDAKVHSSMAHLYGHPRVWMESFHSSGWGGTLEDTWDWLLPLLRSGANLYNPHASYFGTAAGWFEWAPPSTDWRQPYWAHYPQFAAAVARTTSLLTWGTYDADVALLHPTATAQADLTLDAPVHHFGTRDVGDAAPHADRASQDYTALSGINNWFQSEPGLLDAAGIAFDVVDDASLQVSVIDDGRVAIRDQRYRTVVLPSARVLEEGTAQRLLELLDAGGRVVVVGAAPELAAGTAGDDAVARAVADHPRVVRVATPREAVTALAATPLGDAGSWPSATSPCSCAVVTGTPWCSSAAPTRTPAATRCARAAPAGTTSTSTARDTPRHGPSACEAPWPRRRSGTPRPGSAPRCPSATARTAGASSTCRWQVRPSCCSCSARARQRCRPHRPARHPPSPESAHGPSSTVRGPVSWCPPWTTPGVTWPCRPAPPWPTCRSGRWTGPREVTMPPMRRRPSGSSRGPRSGSVCASSGRCRRATPRRR